ncbi:hypothetical protein M9H77_02247 [Catharanthus roseus]|uniref:Uncharacterized protein n=1 Tax=Catharanthus roseus TaxID=4058 RepID=A0ACC0C7U0_CATRO|nr:hypothetical protein M9H77_02247 [Catharanthus roseus]
MVDSSCVGTFLHKTANEAWDLFENLSDNSQQHATSSRIGTVRQIGNKVGMYVPPYPPQSGNSMFEEKVLSALKGLESMTQILDSHTQSIAKLETQIGQLANAISRRDEGKLPSHPIENSRANYHEQAKAVITLRNGKLVDNKVGEPIKDKNLICTEDVNSNIACITPFKNSSWIENHEVMNLCSISVITFA